MEEEAPRHKARRRWAARTAAAVLAAVALYFVIGHASHAPIGDGGAIHGLGICLVVVAFAATLLLPPPPRMVQPVAVALVQTPVVWSAVLPMPDARARASPAWLARFLN